MPPPWCKDSARSVGTKAPISASTGAGLGGDPALFQRYASELVAHSPDVLVAFSSPSVEAMRRETTTIPMVFTVVSDPIGQGFVASLAHPGGNITGFSAYDPPMAGKWLQMLTQITPPVANVVVLYNPATAPYAGLMLHAIEEAAPSLRVSVRAAPYRDDAELEAIMAGLGHEEHGGLLFLRMSSPSRTATPSSRSPPDIACRRSIPTALSPRVVG